MLRIYFCIGWLLAGTLAFSARAQSPAPPFDLALPVGPQLGNPFPTSEPTGTVADSWGNVYVTGYYTGVARFGPFTLGSTAPSLTQKSFLAKLDANGTYEWVQEVSGRPMPIARRTLAVDAAGNVYLVGNYTGASADFGPLQLRSSNTANGKLFVAKLTPAGTYLGAWQADATSETYGTGLALDPAGNVYVTGAFRPGTVSFGATTLSNSQTNYAGHNAFVAKLSAGGSWAWAVQSVGSSYGFIDDGGESIAVTDQGEAYITGTFNSGIVSFGAAVLNGANAYSDAFVAKVDAGGRWAWAHRIGGGSYDHGVGVALGTAGQVYVCGTYQGQMDANSLVRPPNTSGSFDMYVALLDAGGTVQWATHGGGSDVDLVTGLTTDAEGNAYVAGYFDSAASSFGSATLTNSSGPYHNNALVAKIDARGAWQWAQQSTGTGDDRAYGLAVDPSGVAWVIGACRSPTTGFGAVSLPGQAPGVTGFLARLASAPYLPLVGSVNPANGTAGQVVLVSGARFTGATEVAFGGVPATSYAVLSATAVRAVVPAGARSGRVSVRTTIGNSGPGPAFQFLQATATAAPLEHSWEAWPNPVTEDRLVHFRGAGHRPAGAAVISVRSVLGQVVRAFAGQLPATVSLQGLAPGAYVVTLTEPGLAPQTHQLLLQ